MSEHDAGVSPEPRFEISRITRVRVHGTLDARSLAQLERVCWDLVHDHGVTELLLDVTTAADPAALLVELVEAVDTWIAEREGTLELRLPASPTGGLIEAATDVPTFTPIDPEGDT